MTQHRLAMLILIVSLGFALPCLAGYDEGVAAYRKGDFNTAFAEFLVLAEAGHDSSQYNLGVMYAKGQHVSKDFIQARRWFAAAAAQGHPMAQGSLGVMFAKGQGGDKNLPEAKFWLDTALANPRASEAYKKTAKLALDEVMAEISPHDLERAQMLETDRPPIVSEKKYKMSSAFMQNPEKRQIQPPANPFAPDASAPALPPALQASESAKITAAAAESEKSAAVKKQDAAPAQTQPDQRAEPAKTNAAATEPEKTAAESDKTAVAKPQDATADEDENLSGEQDEAPKAKSGGKHKKKHKKKTKKPAAKQTQPAKATQP
ncbi:MAG: sel1 repeat family protein [Desulfovibrionaceae bacterium]|nr:sel1 repeat family protein [Desulfovibrionaceae bacterium]MBF0513484.1 sel1 repeat family protein [Desulfovibrionaceae bacterium]